MKNNILVVLLGLFSYLLGMVIYLFHSPIFPIWQINQWLAELKISENHEKNGGSMGWRQILKLFLHISRLALSKHNTEGARINRGFLMRPLSIRACFEIVEFLEKVVLYKFIFSFYFSFLIRQSTSIRTSRGGHDNRIDLSTNWVFWKSNDSLLTMVSSGLNLVHVICCKWSALSVQVSKL